MRCLNRHRQEANLAITSLDEKKVERCSEKKRWRKTCPHAQNRDYLAAARFGGKKCPLKIRSLQVRGFGWMPLTFKRSTPWKSTNLSIFIRFARRPELSLGPGCITDRDPRTHFYTKCPRLVTALGRTTPARRNTSPPQARARPLRLLSPGPRLTGLEASSPQGFRPL